MNDIEKMIILEKIKDINEYLIGLLEIRHKEELEGLYKQKKKVNDFNNQINEGKSLNKKIDNKIEKLLKKMDGDNYET